AVYYDKEKKDYVAKETFEAKTTQTYTIVGVVSRSHLEGYVSAGYTAFVGREDAEISTVTAYLQYWNVKKTVDTTQELIKVLGVSDDAVSYNNSLLMMLGVSKYENVMGSMTRIIIVMLTIVSVACVMVIYN